MPIPRIGPSSRSAMSASRVRISWSEPSTSGHLGPPAHEGLGHLQADVAAADHDDRPAPRGRGRDRAAPWRRRGSARRGRGRGRCRAGRAGWAGRRWPRAAGRTSSGIVRWRAWSRTSSVRAGEVDAEHLVLQPDVDALLAELGRGARHEVVERGHVARHQVRDAAGGVARPRALLEGDDLEVRLPATGLHGRRHAAGVSSDHHEPVRHGRRLPVRRMRDFRPWPCGRTVATTPRARCPRATSCSGAGSTRPRWRPSPAPPTASSSSPARSPTPAGSASSPTDEE